VPTAAVRSVQGTKLVGLRVQHFGEISNKVSQLKNVHLDELR
jgi:hypothetical protein